MGGSRREILNDMAELRPILKNNTHHPRFGSTPNTGAVFPKTGFCFDCVAWHEKAGRCGGIDGGPDLVV